MDVGSLKWSADSMHRQLEQGNYGHVERYSESPIESKVVCLYSVADRFEEGKPEDALNANPAEDEEKPDYR